MKKTLINKEVKKETICTLPPPHTIKENFTPILLGLNIILRLLYPVAG